MRIVHALYYIKRRTSKTATNKTLYRVAAYHIGNVENKENIQALLDEKNNFIADLPKKGRSFISKKSLNESQAEASFLEELNHWKKSEPKCNMIEINVTEVLGKRIVKAKMKQTFE